jgi:hypothetical protein
MLAFGECITVLFDLADLAIMQKPFFFKLEGFLMLFD